ncbi:MAG: hypothetical protein LPH21_07065 [Shewanella sp.]|nr:hypothetical protein [Shewanella sp.]MCF1431252.1 hypothetical protein [Shewanella sp.]MCF1457318.1 hypothetical protein [Shewanella sp.]
MAQLNHVKPSLASDYAQWETLRVYGFVLPLGQKHKDSEFDAAVTAVTIFDALSAFTESQVAKESTSWRMVTGH